MPDSDCRGVTATLNTALRAFWDYLGLMALGRLLLRGCVLSKLSATIRTEVQISEECRKTNKGNHNQRLETKHITHAADLEVSVLADLGYMAGSVQLPFSLLLCLNLDASKAWPSRKHG